MKARWNLILPLMVVLVASVYWIASLFLHAGALDVAAMYVPNGDTQCFPTIKAMSQFNFGDAVDPYHHGQGVASYPFLCVLPYAIAVHWLGWWGFWPVNVIFCLGYFYAAAWLLRECGVNHTLSLWLALALATNVLQTVMGCAADGFTALMNLFHVRMWESAFTILPNFFSCPIFSQRLQRPMTTEPVMVVLLAMAVRTWREGYRSPLRSLIGGLCLSYLYQSDPFTAFTLSLLLLASILRSPVRLANAVCFIGGFAFLIWPWMIQRAYENSDVVRRCGVESYGHEFLILPGTAGLLRVLLVLGVAWLARPFAGKLSSFFPLLLICGWLAQPLQIFLTGRSGQIYHYDFNLVILESYALLAMGAVMFQNRTTKC